MYHHRGRPPPKKAPSLRAPRNDRFRPRHAPIDQVVRLPPTSPYLSYLDTPPGTLHDPVELWLSLAAIGVTMRLGRSIAGTRVAINLLSLAAITTVNVQTNFSQPPKPHDPEIFDPHNGTRLLAT